MNPIRRRLLQGLALFPAAVLWRPGLLAAETAPGAGLETATLTIHGEQGPHRLSVEKAHDIAERGRGLMGREQLPDEAGMLFLYERTQPSRMGFWMYRTLIPLDIAFIDEAGRIAEIHRMTPCAAESPRDCPVTRPGGPYRAALEVNAGYFEARGIVAGDCVSWPGDGGECRFEDGD